MHQLIQYIKVLLRFRFLQIGREFRATGLFISVLILVSLLILMGTLTELLSNPDHAIYVLLASFVPVSIVAVRKDHAFLKKFSKNYQVMICADLILFSLPFLLIFTLKSHFHFIPVLSSMILFAAYRPVTISASSAIGIKLKLISGGNFEWRTGIRQYRFLFLLLYIFTIVLLPFPIVSLAGIWLLHLLIISFYQYNEPASFIAAYGQNGKAILYSKTRSALTMQAIIQFPLIVLYVVFHEGEVLIPGILLLMLQISLVFVIIAKYAFYHPDSPAGPSQFYQYLSFISFVIPFLIPVPLVLSLVWIKKAILNLNKYVTGH